MNEVLKEYQKSLRIYKAFYQYLQPILDERFPMKDNPQNITCGAMALPHPNSYKAGSGDIDSPERMLASMKETMEFYKARLSTFSLTKAQTFEIKRIMADKEWVRCN